MISYQTKVLLFIKIRFTYTVYCKIRQEKLRWTISIYNDIKCTRKKKLLFTYISNLLRTTLSRLSKVVRNDFMSSTTLSRRVHLVGILCRRNKVVREKVAPYDFRQEIYLDKNILKVDFASTINIKFVKQN